MLFKNVLTTIALVSAASAVEFAGRYYFSMDNEFNVCYDAYELNLESDGTFVKRSKNCDTMQPKLSYGAWSKVSDTVILENHLPKFELEEVEFQAISPTQMRYGNSNLDRSTQVKSIDFVTNLFGKWQNKNKSIEFNNNGRLTITENNLAKVHFFAIKEEKIISNDFAQVSGTGTNNGATINWTAKVSLKTALVFNGEEFTKVIA